MAQNTAGSNELENSFKPEYDSTALSQTGVWIIGTFPMGRYSSIKRFAIPKCSIS